MTAPPQRAVPRPVRPRTTPRTAAGAAARQRSESVVSTPGGPLRWSRVALLVLFVLIGLPLAHAVWGEVAALLGGAVLFGFLLGRWTAV